MDGKGANKRKKNEEKENVSLQLYLCDIRELFVEMSSGPLYSLLNTEIVNDKIIYFFMGKRFKRENFNIRKNMFKRKPGFEE